MCLLQRTHQDAEVNMEALRRLNAASQEADSAATPRDIWARSKDAPHPAKPISFLYDTPPADNSPAAVWAALQKKSNKTSENVLHACKYKPVVFSLTLLAKGFCDSRKRQEKQPNSRKLHAAWVEFWNTDVLAGLVLRAQAEHMYEPAFRSRLPEPLTARLTDGATSISAAMLHLDPSEVTWGALYVYFLARVSAYLQSCRGCTVNVQTLGRYLAGFFQPTLSSEAGSPGPVQHTAMVHFWSNDALAAYLLSSLVRLLGGEPSYSDMADMLDNAPETDASNVLRSPSTAPRPAVLAATPTSIDRPIVLDDAESEAPHDSHWLLRSAPKALTDLSDDLRKLQQHDGPAAITAVQKAAVHLRESDNETWQFLRQFAGLPEDTGPWDDPLPPKAANGADGAAAADGVNAAAHAKAKPPGELSSWLSKRYYISSIFDILGTNSNPASASFLVSQCTILCASK